MRNRNISRAMYSFCIRSRLRKRNCFSGIILMTLRNRSVSKILHSPLMPDFLGKVVMICTLQMCINFLSPNCNERIFFSPRCFPGPTSTPPSVCTPFPSEICYIGKLATDKHMCGIQTMEVCTKAPPQHLQIPVQI